MDARLASLVGARGRGTPQASNWVMNPPRPRAVGGSIAAVTKSAQPMALIPYKAGSVLLRYPAG